MNFVVKNGSKMRAQLGGHAAAGVADFEEHVVALGQVAREVRVREIAAVRTHEAGGEGDDAAAVADGLGGVDDEVHHDLPELRGVGQDGRQAGAEIELQHGLLADGDLQEVRGVLHEQGEVEGLDNEAALAGVGEHLAAEVGGAEGGLFNLLERMLDGRTRREVHAREACVAQDAGEEIIEVVRDAPCKHAQALELLRLLQLQLHPLALLLHVGALDSRAENLGGGLQRLQLGGGTVALVVSLAEREEAPPRLAREDGRERDGLHALAPGDVALRGGQCAHVSVDGFAAGEQLAPPLATAGPVTHRAVGSRFRRRRPETMRTEGRFTVERLVAEEAHGVGAGGLAQFGEHFGRDSLPGGRVEKRPRGACHGAQNPVAPLQRLLVAAALRDVTHVYQGGALPFEVNTADGQLNGNDAPVLGEALTLQNRSVVGEQLGEVAADIRAMRRGHKLGDVPAEQLRARHALKLAGGGIGIEHDSGGAVHEDGVGRTFKERPEPRLALRGRLLLPGSRGDFCGQLGVGPCQLRRARCDGRLHMGLPPKHRAQEERADRREKKPAGQRTVSLPRPRRGLRCRSLERALKFRARRVPLADPEKRPERQPHAQHHHGGDPPSVPSRPGWFRG